MCNYARLYCTLMIAERYSALFSVNSELYYRRSLQWLSCQYQNVVSQITRVTGVLACHFNLEIQDWKLSVLCHYSLKTVAEVASDPIEPHKSRSWRPPPSPVPATEPTIASCSIIQVNYYPKIKASISGAINPHVDFVLFLGKCQVKWKVLLSASSYHLLVHKTCMQFLYQTSQHTVNYPPCRIQGIYCKTLGCF